MNMKLFLELDKFARDINILLDPLKGEDLKKRMDLAVNSNAFESLISC